MEYKSIRSESVVNVEFIQDFGISKNSINFLRTPSRTKKGFAQSVDNEHRFHPRVADRNFGIVRSNDPGLGVGVHHGGQVLATLQPMGAFVSNQFTNNPTASATPRTRATCTGDFGLRGRSVPNRLTDRAVRHSIAMADHHSDEFLFSRSHSGRRSPSAPRPTGKPGAQNRPPSKTSMENRN